jgi:hypothetical protein
LTYWMFTVSGWTGCAVGCGEGVVSDIEVSVVQGPPSARDEARRVARL